MHCYKTQLSQIQTNLQSLIIIMGCNKLQITLAFISDKGFELRFVKISAGSSDDFIHLILVISLLLIYSFNAAISIRNCFSLTYFEDFNASNSDSLSVNTSTSISSVYILYKVLLVYKDVSTPSNNAIVSVANELQAVHLNCFDC